MQTRGKPNVSVQTSLCRSSGFSASLGQDFHITNRRAFTWDQIHTAIGEAFEVEARS
jgi:hypothetical protein